MPSKKQKNRKKHHGHHNGQPNAQNSNTEKNSNPLEENEENSLIVSDATNQLPYKVGNSEIYGRYLTASRDLKAGELLITEKPLAIGPCISADAVCLGCYKPVELKISQYRCPSCNWPMCSAQCRGYKQPEGHTEYECKFLTACKAAAGDLLGSRSTPVEVKNLYELILIVRILSMKTQAADNYAKVLCMESHYEQRKQNTELWQHYQLNVVERLRKDWHLTEFNEMEIHTICGIVDVNCFEIGQKSAKARTLYPSAFLLAHDCCPNTSHTDDPETYAIILRTSRKLRKNEAITLSYAYTLQGTYKRRDFMHAGKLFWCSCKRCSDPMELGTDCSAIICMKCKKGSIRAVDPLNQDADWKCDKCNFVIKALEIVQLLDKINDDLESIDAHDVKGLENFLKRFQNILRPNHYLLLSAKYSLCQIYGRIEGYLLTEMSLEDIKRKEKYCREFLEAIDVLEPGLTRLRALIMYELHAPVLVTAQYLMQNNLMSRRDFNNCLKEVIKLLRESRDILLMEPAGSNEHQMGLAAADALTKMECS